MTTITLRDLLAEHNIAVPDETIAEITVPVLTGPQRQGDVAIFPRKPLGQAQLDRMADVPATGVQVVRGEATGNTHLLHPAGGRVRWQAAAPNGDPAQVLLGTLVVDDDAVCFLIHTDEHGANGIGPGTYALHGKREMADEIRRVAD